MNEQVKGKCKYCGKEYARGYVIRHLASCKERMLRLEQETGKRKCGYFELLIYGKYNHDYWLVIEVKDTVTLGDVDQFLRDIWLECCGHLSAFKIGGVCFEESPEESLLEREVRDMSCKLKTVLQKGMSIHYEYDFGSMTELVIDVKDYRTGYDKKEKFLILSRNNPQRFVCGKCGVKDAIYIVPEFAYDGNPFLCEKCSKRKEYEDELLLKVCNSPRMGVCGYDGSTVYPDDFVPDPDRN